MKEGIQTQHYSKILLTNHDSSLANSPFRMKGRILNLLTLSKLFLFIVSLLLIAPIAFMLKKLKKKDSRINRLLPVIESAAGGDNQILLFRKGSFQRGLKLSGVLMRSMGDGFSCFE